MRWGIVVLAAGASTRMGRPKMTLPWGEDTVLGRVAGTLDLAMGGRRAATVVVTGADEKRVREEVARLDLASPPSCVTNPDFRNGEMIDSLRIGLGSMPSEVEAALLALGDQPQLSVDAARSVIEAAERSGSLIVVPAHGGRRGHPWALRRELWAGLCASRTAREFLEARPGEIEECPADETVLKDLDFPSDYERDAPRAR